MSGRPPLVEPCVTEAAKARPPPGLVDELDLPPELVEQLARALARVLAANMRREGKPAYTASDSGASETACLTGQKGPHRVL